MDNEPNHVESMMQRLADVHADFHRSGTRLHRLLVGVTGILARPFVLICTVLAIAVWIFVNSVGARWRWDLGDPPPFAKLQAVASVAALVTTLLILVAQRREDELARRRLQLTLQIATQSEAMIAKVIGLIESRGRRILSCRTARIERLSRWPVPQILSRCWIRSSTRIVTPKIATRIRLLFVFNVLGQAFAFGVGEVLKLLLAHIEHGF
jgi:uncharacterized membrane protein